MKPNKSRTEDGRDGTDQSDADIPVDDPGPILDGSSYIASVCSSTAFAVKAIEIELS